MSRTYAIADLHGCFDLLVNALDAIREHAQGVDHSVVMLGDYIDRGPDSAKVVLLLMASQGPDTGLICLKGNHEDMMIETLTTPLHPDWWIGNGGDATLLSYGHAESGEYDPSVVPLDHVAWLQGLPMMHVDKHRVFVHAGVDPQKQLDQQDKDTLLWKLYQDNDGVGHGQRHVVHGHQPFKDGPLLYTNRTDLDTFAWATGRIVIGVFDDDVAGGPADLIEVFGSKELQGDI